MILQVGAGTARWLGLVADAPPADPVAVWVVVIPDAEVHNRPQAGQRPDEVGTDTDLSGGDGDSELSAPSAEESGLVLLGEPDRVVPGEKRAFQRSQERSDLEHGRRMAGASVASI